MYIILQNVRSTNILKKNYKLNLNLCLIVINVNLKLVETEKKILVSHENKYSNLAVFVFHTFLLLM